MIHLKYEFTDKEQAESKINSAKEDLIKAEFISLGFLVINQPVYDENGDILTEAVVSSKYAVDVVWYELEESPYGWKSYEVTPTNPKHKILGWD